MQYIAFFLFLQAPATLGIIHFLRSCPLLFLTSAPVPLHILILKYTESFEIVLLTRA